MGKISCDGLMMEEDKKKGMQEGTQRGVSESKQKSTLGATREGLSVNQSPRSSFEERRRCEVVKRESEKNSRGWEDRMIVV